MTRSGEYEGPPLPVRTPTPTLAIGNTRPRRGVPTSSQLLLGLSLVAVVGAAIAATGLAFTDPDDNLARAGYLAGLAAGAITISLVAYMAEGRRQAVLAARMRTHRLGTDLSHGAEVQYLPSDRLDQAALDLALLEAVGDREHANALRKCLGLPRNAEPESDWRAVPQPATRRYSAPGAADDAESGPANGMGSAKD